MADDVKLVDYSTKDYEGYKSDMIDLIPQKLPEWTDRSEADPGIVLLELLAYQLEKQSYYNDRVANETFLETATQRKSVISSCRTIGYELSWGTSAQFYQVFEIVPQADDLVIPKGTQVGTLGTDIEDSIIYETTEDLIIPAGDTGLEQDANGNYLYQVLVEQGQTVTDEYLGDITSTDPYQSLYFTYSPALKDSITVYVEDDNGRFTWNMVDDFISSTQDSQDYIAEMDEFDNVYVQFGTGASGKIPTNPSKVYADYKVTVGATGNVGANTITECYDSIDGFVSTFNPSSAYIEGTDKETIESAKVNGPASLKRLERYVTLPDYETGLPQDYSGLAKVKAINNSGNVDLYIAPVGADTLTATQKSDILALLDDKKVMFTTITVNDPVYVTVNVTVNIIADTNNYNANDIQYSAENTITDMFDPANLDFGQDITIAKIHQQLFTIDGVQNPIVSSPSADVSIGDTEIAKLGTVTITVTGS